MIEGIPDGWELVRIGKPKVSEYYIDVTGSIYKALDTTPTVLHWYMPIIRKIEKPKRYRPFANAAEYVANRREGFSVDWKSNTIAPGFHAVVSANESFLWVAFGTVVERFEWGQAFEKLEFRHVDNTTSPFGIEVTE